MTTPDYIKNTDTPTDYGQPIQNPVDPITRGALYAFEEDPNIVLAEANEERKKYKQQVKNMSNDLDNYITIKFNDEHNIEGAIKDFKQKQIEAKKDKFLKELQTRKERREKSIAKSVTLSGNKQGTGGRKTRRRQKKSHKTMRRHRKHRRRTHRKY